MKLRNNFKKIVCFCFGASMLTSMAGLEIFSSFALLIFFLDALFNKRVKEFLTPTYWLFPLVFFSIFSLFINEHFSKIGFMLGWHRWIFIFAVFVYIFRYGKEESKNLIKGFYAGAIVSFINCFYQYATGYDFIRGKKIGFFSDLAEQSVRVTSFFNLPTTYAYALSLFLFLPLGQIVFNRYEKNKSHFFFQNGVFFTGIICLFLTGTRGSWIAFFIGAGVLGLFASIKKTLASFGAVALCFSTFFFGSQGFNERIVSLFDLGYYSNSQRIDLWKANLFVFKENPIFGTGLRRVTDHLPRVFDILSVQDGYISHAHNTYLEYLAGSGVVGFAALCLPIVLLLLSTLKTLGKKGYRQPRDAALFLCASLCFLLSCMVDCNLRDAEVRFSALFFLAMLLTSTFGVDRYQFCEDPTGEIKT